MSDLRWSLAAIAAAVLTAEEQARWDAEMATRLNERTCDVCRRCKRCRRNHVGCRRCSCDREGMGG